MNARTSRPCARKITRIGSAPKFSTFVFTRHFKIIGDEWQISDRETVLSPKFSTTERTRRNWGCLGRRISKFNKVPPSLWYHTHQFFENQTHIVNDNRGSIDDTPFDFLHGSSLSRWLSMYVISPSPSTHHHHHLASITSPSLTSSSQHSAIARDTNPLDFYSQSFDEKDTFHSLHVMNPSSSTSTIAATTKIYHNNGNNTHKVPPLRAIEVVEQSRPTVVLSHPAPSKYPTASSTGNPTSHSTTFTSTTSTTFTHQHQSVLSSSSSMSNNSDDGGDMMFWNRIEKDFTCLLLDSTHMFELFCLWLIMEQEEELSRHQQLRATASSGKLQSYQQQQVTHRQQLQQQPQTTTPLPLHSLQHPLQQQQQQQHQTQLQTQQQQDQRDQQNTQSSTQQWRNTRQSLGNIQNEQNTPTTNATTTTTTTTTNTNNNYVLQSNNNINNNNNKINYLKRSPIFIYEEAFLQIVTYFQYAIQKQVNEPITLWSDHKILDVFDILDTMDKGQVTKESVFLILCTIASSVSDMVPIAL